MKYKEIMDHVTVTEEMQQRILNHVEEKIQQKKRWKRLYFGGGLVAVATIVIMSGVVAHMFREDAFGNGRAGRQIESAIPDIEEVGSADEMSDLLGFKVPEPEMPFEVKERTYLVSWGELGEIDYEGKDQSAYFRISREKEDNSGDYNEYENIVMEKINSTAVTLKGNQDRWNLAIWQKGEYSYSLGFEKGIAMQQIKEIIESLI